MTERELTTLVEVFENKLQELVKHNIALFAGRGEWQADTVDRGSDNRQRIRHKASNIDQILISGEFGGLEDEELEMLGRIRKTFSTLHTLYDRELLRAASLKVVADMAKSLDVKCNL